MKKNINVPISDSCGFTPDEWGECENSEMNQFRRALGKALKNLLDPPKVIPEVPSDPPAES